MTISLPEERLLLGKAQGQGVEPVDLDAREDDLTRFKERARVIFDTQGHFSTDEVHQILARVVLGL